jgi:ABC-type cobalamin transport system permease subunit
MKIAGFAEDVVVTGRRVESPPALGISGAVMQGLFRNPLAEPGAVGVSSGAAAVR